MLIQVHDETLTFDWLQIVFSLKFRRFLDFIEKNSFPSTRAQSETSAWNSTTQILWSLSCLALAVLRFQAAFRGREISMRKKYLKRFDRGSRENSANLKVYAIRLNSTDFPWFFFSNLSSFRSLKTFLKISPHDEEIHQSPETFFLSRTLAFLRWDPRSRCARNWRAPTEKYSKDEYLWASEYLKVGSREIAEEISNVILSGVSDNPGISTHKWTIRLSLTSIVGSKFEWSFATESIALQC